MRLFIYIKNIISISHVLNLLKTSFYNWYDIILILMCHTKMYNHTSRIYFNKIYIKLNKILKYIKARRAKK